MGRKKKRLSRPWCWYCNREFEDEKILIQHQKAKHFKCHICHKKLYTGPGLSIHCMQVHKEAIDKVPNSLSNRSNIEIEIYGMEGIPEEDLKEHERQRQGTSGGKSDSDEEPTPKKLKTDNQSTVPQMPPGMMSAPGMMGMPQFPPMGHMMGHMGAVGPPFMHGIPQMPICQPQTSGTDSAAIATSGAAAKPLFPSAMAMASGQTPGVSGAATPGKPTFPAYGKPGGSPNIAEPPKVVLINTVGASSKIMHPQEDISLEEHRARMSKYKVETPSLQQPVGITTVNNEIVGVPMSGAQISAASAFSLQQQIELGKQQQAIATAAINAATAAAAASMMPRFQQISAVPMSMATMVPPNSVAYMAPMHGAQLIRPTMTLAPTAAMLGPGNVGMLRPSPVAFPGLTGAIPMMNPYTTTTQMAFPGQSVLTPMMHPRFR